MFATKCLSAFFWREVLLLIIDKDLTQWEPAREVLFSGLIY